MDISHIIAMNLTTWMEGHPSLDTLKKLAARAGVGYGTVRRARKAEGNLTVENAEAIARAFGKTTRELVTPVADANMVAEPGVRYLSGELPNGERRRAQQIIELMQQTNEFGQVALLEKAKDLRRDYPRTASGNAM